MNNKVGELVLVFLSILNQIKIYHWQTKKYSRHIASDTLFTNLSLNIDKFIEVLLGKYADERFKMPANNEISLDNQTDNSILELLKTFKQFLVKSVSKYISSNDTDLINIRDDMLSNIEQTLYLFTLE